MDIVKTVMKLSLGMKINQLDMMPTTKKYVCSRYVFPNNPGLVQRFDFPVIDNNNVTIEKFYNVGDYFNERVASVCKAGMVRVLADTRKDAEQLAERIIRKVVIVNEFA